MSEIEHPKSSNDSDLSKKTIVQLLGMLRVSQAWALVVGIVALVVGAFTVGSHWSQPGEASDEEIRIRQVYRTVVKISTAYNSALKAERAASSQERDKELESVQTELDLAMKAAEAANAFQEFSELTKAIALAESKGVEIAGLKTQIGIARSDLGDQLD